MEKTMSVPIFRVSREIVTDKFDELYALLKPKGVTVSAMLAKAVAEVLKKVKSRRTIHLSIHSINVSCHHTLSTYPVFTISMYSLTYCINIPSQTPLKPRYRSTLASHRQRSVRRRGHQIQQRRQCRHGCSDRRWSYHPHHHQGETNTTHILDTTSMSYPIRYPLISSLIYPILSSTLTPILT